MKTDFKFHRYLRHLLFPFILMLLFQTGNAQVVGEDAHREGQMMQTAKETVAAYEEGNWEALRRHAAQDAMFYNLGSYDSLTLDQTINYWKKGRETATPVLVDGGVWLANSVSEGPRKGDWILHWGNNTLSYPTGETVSFPYHVALKFKNHKVQEVHFYYDNNRIIRAMGYGIQPPLEELDNEIIIDAIEDKN